MHLVPAPECWNRLTTARSWGWRQERRHL
jgi:hypothetical protein